jgi:MoxR-like ATPase
MSNQATLNAPHNALLAAQQQINAIVLGKPQAVKLALACLLAKGHLLIEDQPGVGKTLLATTLAHCLGLHTARVQFSSDLMPSDITGTQIYRKDSEQFQFKAGPVFTQVLLADEINRAPSKSQSALLQAMEERVVSVDGEAHPLPAPFFVLATQNPLSQIGTFPLPESQLDRFLMRIGLGLPNVASERALLAGQSPREAIQAITPSANAALVLAAQQACVQVHVSEALLDYVQALIAASRSHVGLAQGLSPRGALALMAASKSFAWLSGNGYATADDVQSVWLAVAGHRVLAKNNANTLLACLGILKTTPLAQ